MRIVAGRYRGLPLLAPRGLNTRPTAQRARESLFNHLQHQRLPHGFIDLRVLDLYAGTGALGIEALSRGACHATFIESGPEALHALRSNLSACRAQDDATRVLTAPLPQSLHTLHGHPFDLIFADPPYDLPMPPALFAALATPRLSHPNTLLLVEHRARSGPPDATPWRWLDTRPAGEGAFSFFQHPDATA